MTTGRRHGERTGYARALTRIFTALLLALVGLLGSAGSAAAETTTERSASILIFPKVVYDTSRDTFIQISNTSNSMVHALCFYVNAAPICLGAGDCLSGTCTGRCEPQWQEIDFSIWLTKQQPTHWLAGFGRFTNPLDDQCNRDTKTYDCDGAGIDPGRVPPVAFPFMGELRCIEVDQSGAPISGNHLKGEATIVTSDGDASKYNAVGLLGEGFTNNGDNTLCLGGAESDQCPSGAEYEGCGQLAIINHFAEGADTLLFGPTSRVDTQVTIVPCRADYERQIPTRIQAIQLLGTNEFEQRFSASVIIDCWADLFLRDISSIFDVLTMQSRFVQTTMRASDGAISGFVGVIEEYHRVPGLGGPAQVARAAFDLHWQGTRQKTDLIFIPEGP